MHTVVSGIRPTGKLHLGNYFGAVKNFIRMQEDHDCYFFVADYHSLTTHPNPENLRNNVESVMAEYLACGIDPERCTLYVQSDIPQIPELYLIFNMLANKGELERVATFKEKARQHAGNVNAGLLTYPVLMAVDIIIQRAERVPVGKDQQQHLEMTRNFVQRFHHLYKTEVFPEPVAFNFGGELIKIPGLDGSGKMGKSEGEKNAVYLTEDPKTLRKKVMRAVTDSGPVEAGAPMSEPVSNLFQLMEILSPAAVVSEFRAAYADGSIRYGDMKKQLAEDMIAFTAPIKEKYEGLMARPDYLREIRAAGAAKASANAKLTLDKVREAIGLGY